ncbi:hypothetical protein JCM3766R1_001308 [Sporobolomyces carnicolor]
MASRATYNVTRFTRQVLKRYRRSPPSVVVHLYPNHFRFEHQHGNFAYDSPMKCFLESIREQKLATDLLDVFDDAHVPFYEGCLIVEVHDHRHYATEQPQPQPSRPGQLPPSKLFTFSITPSLNPNSSYNHQAEVYRIVLAPNPATLATELAIHSPDLAPNDHVAIEAQILNRTAPALCLDPSTQASRIANSMLRATTLRPPKRKRFCHSDSQSDDDDDDDQEVVPAVDDAALHPNRATVTAEDKPMTKRERDRYEKLMKTGDEGIAKLKGPAFSRLAFIQTYRERQSNPAPPPASQAQSHAQAQAQAQAQKAALAASSSSSLKAQPGSAITSIRLGGSAAGAAAAAGGRGVSPAVSASTTTTKHRGGGGGGGGDMSDGATSTASGTTTTSKKKKQSGGASGGSDAASLEKKQQRLLQKKRDKERKLIQQQQQRTAAASGSAFPSAASSSSLGWNGGVPPQQ